MTDNFTYKYPSGAEVTIRATEDASATPSVYTIHVNAQAVDSDGDAINSDNPLQVQITDGTTALTINADGTVNVREFTVRDLTEQMLTALKKIEYHLSIATDTNLNDQDV